VHWCSQQRGHPGISLDHYGADDLRREYHEAKTCAPFCTVGCVHRVAQVNELRRDPETALAQWFPASAPGSAPTLPLSVRILQWTFVTNPRRQLFRDAVSAVLGGQRRS
jgi:hypothetical protein